jgi:hypothetical protein
MSGRKEWFECYSDDQCVNKTLADNSTIPSGGVGNIPLRFPDDIKTLRNVRHVPVLAANLVSVSAMTKNNLAVVFINDKCEVFHQDDFQYSGTVQFNASITDGLYKLNTAPSEIKNSVIVTNESDNVLDFCNQCMSASMSPIELWHKRMGHLNEKDLKLMDQNEVAGIQAKGNMTKSCTACQEGKQSRKTFRGITGSVTKELLELVHSDICGPLPESVAVNICSPSWMIIVEKYFLIS